ncbi:MAG: hypothetical protein E6767_00890 [Dysgonomonas sp.]|nr:hypothetical protein [Dysgonomonas sp.]
MGMKDILKAGDILYRVDPKRLSVKVFRISQLEEKLNKLFRISTSYEDFSIERGEQKQIQLPVDQFPFEFNGRLYFLTEDEANNYIKTQIGM